MSTDADIVERIRAGDQEAFVSLVHRHQGTVFALAHHYVRDFHDAQEIAQEAFFKVYRRLDTLSSPKSFPAWLRSIVHTEAMMRLRADGRRVPAVTLSEESLGVVVRDAQRHAAQQRRASVREALGTLPEDLRLLVELRYLGGCNSREIGDLLGMKPGTVRYQLHKAIESLREVFEVVKEELHVQQLPESFADEVLKSLGCLKGRVIGVDGRPLGGIRLELDQLLSPRGSFSSKAIAVAADGTFSLDIPNWRRYRAGEIEEGEFRIGLFGPVGDEIRYLNTAVKLKVGEQAEGIVVDLRDDGHRLRVRVIDPEGQPVPDARVGLHVQHPNTGGHGFFDTYDGQKISYLVTDAEGLTPVLHLSALGYSFSVGATGFRKVERSWTGLQVPEDVPEDGVVEIRLDRGARISGRVTDAEGSPVAQAKLALRGFRHEDRAWRVGRYINLSCTSADDVFSDEEGRFAFTSLEPAGHYCLHAYHEAHGVDCALDVPVGSDDLAFELMRLVSLCGTVQKDGKPAVMPEKQGEPLADRIYIEFVESTDAYAKFNDPRISPHRSCTIHVHTDDSGSFQIDHLFPGATYKLRIAFEGKEYEHSVTLGQEAQTRVALRLDQNYLLRAPVEPSNCLALPRLSSLSAPFLRG